MTACARNFALPPLWLVALVVVIGCSSESGSTNQPLFNGAPQPGPVAPGPVAPGPVTPGPVTPGPVAPGPVGNMPGPINGPVAGGDGDGNVPPVVGAMPDAGMPGPVDMTDDSGMPMADAAMAPTCDKDLTPQPGQNDCTAPLKPGDDRLCQAMIGGRMRQFYIYASPAYDPCTPASLIMDCHGLSESAEVHIGKEGFNLSGQMYPSGYGSGWRMAVQKDNAIVVTPQGLNDSWSTASDVPFVNEAADMVEAIANVDPEHEYVTGISMGGMMTVATGCADANRWRGMSPVAMLSQSCASLAKPTPVISFHATGDQLTSYPSDRSLMQRIAGFNNCKQGPTAWNSYGGPNSSSDPVCYVTPNGVGDPDAPDPFNVPLQACPSSAPATTCERWSECDDGVEVVFCTVAAGSQPIGGHILYNNDTQLDLAEVAWPFFKKFWK